MFSEMNFEEAKQKQKELYAIMNGVQFPVETNSGVMGLTPDNIKFSPEYKKATLEFNVAFQNLRKFNAWFTKRFKKELRAERNARKENGTYGNGE